MDFSSFGLTANIAIFIGAAIVIGFSGARLTSMADRFADATGLGEALTGTIFLGFLTALPGLVASVTSAVHGYPAMALGNAMGGIAVQTVALAGADIAYRKANLEHAAASLRNLMQAAVLVSLLGITLLGFTGPDFTFGHIHPVTLVLIAAAIGGMVMVYRTGDHPMWEPRMTKETEPDEPEQENRREDVKKLVVGLLVMGGITGCAGFAAAQSAESFVEELPLSESLVGGLFIALAASIPELVTSIAAVRRGALTLAVSDIVGGNFFDVLFASAADIAYVDGSIFHAEALSGRDIFLTVLTLMLNVILLLGLLYRQKSGPGNIGFESLLMLIVYIGGFVVMVTAM